MAKFRPSPDQIPLDFLLPSSDWEPTTTLPDLPALGVKRVALDTEERDIGLASSRGSGWATKQGYICGVSAAWSNGEGVSSLYVPIQHPETSCTIEPDAVRRWIQSIIDAGIEVICHHSSYDLGWLGTQWGITPPAEDKLQDTLACAVLLDENRTSYSLDSLCQWQSVQGKDKALLLEAGRALGCGQSVREVMSNLWRLPARYVGPYAAADAEATLRLYDQMEPQLRAQDLWEAYRLECHLIPMCVAMRRRGIRIDSLKAEETIRELNASRDTLLQTITDKIAIGRKVTIHDINSPKFLEKIFDAENIYYPRTIKNNQGSFQAEWMEKSEHWLPKTIAAINVYHDAADKFIKGYVLDYSHRGRIHAEIHSLRDIDEERGRFGGTRSHRFSYSDPPLQQMPSPKSGTAEQKRIGLLIRSMFLPEEAEYWYKIDYSQQEYRMMVHFASLLDPKPGKVDDAVEKYRTDRNTDFHSLVVEMTGLDRQQAKNTNFAKAFGAGVKKFATMINKPEDEAKRIMDTYDTEFPFIKALSDQCTKTANRRGYIRLIDGFRARFDQWEPAWGYKGPYHPPCSRKEADARVESEQHDWHGVQLRRAYTHKAMNRLIQGSAARQTKLAMRELWRQGVVPLLQLHDELDVSGANDNAGRLVVQVMQDVVKLEVPVLAECDVGDTWGSATEEVK